MNDMAFYWIVTIMLCISNFQSFIAMCSALLIYKNTEWGRNIPTTIIAGGGDNNDTEG